MRTPVRTTPNRTRVSLAAQRKNTGCVTMTTKLERPLFVWFLWIGRRGLTPRSAYSFARPSKSNLTAKTQVPPENSSGELAGMGVGRGVGRGEGKRSGNKTDCRGWGQTNWVYNIHTGIELVPGIERLISLKWPKWAGRRKNLDHPKIMLMPCVIEKKYP